MVRSPPDATIGCSIYNARPRSCAVWNCQWYAEQAWPDELRPDRCGVIVDIMPDVCRITDNDTGQSVEVPTIQLWAMPGHEDDWRDKPLIMDLIASIIQQTGPDKKQKLAVLWRTRNLQSGSRQDARAFWLTKDGKVGVTDASAATAEMGDVQDRYGRAKQMLGISGP